MADREEGNQAQKKDDSAPSSPAPPQEKQERSSEEGRRGVTRLRDIMRRHRRDSDVSFDKKNSLFYFLNQG